MSSFLHCGPEGWEDVTENSSLPQGRRLLKTWQRWVFQPLWLWETSGLALTSGHSLGTLTLLSLHSVLCFLIQPENISWTLSFLGWINTVSSRQEVLVVYILLTQYPPGMHRELGMKSCLLRATGNYPASNATASPEQIVWWEIDQMISRHLKTRFRAFPPGRQLNGEASQAVHTCTIY